MSVESLIDGLEQRVAYVLGSPYVLLPYVEDTKRNNFKGGVKGYGVLAGNIEQTDGVNSFLTVSHSFTIKIVDRWNPSQTGDISKRTLIESLQEKCLLIYRDIYNTKAGSPLEVINVEDGMYTETNIVDADGILEMGMFIKLTYRKQF